MRRHRKPVASPPPSPMARPGERREMRLTWPPPPSEGWGSKGDEDEERIRGGAGGGHPGRDLGGARGRGGGPAVLRPPPLRLPRSTDPCVSHRVWDLPHPVYDHARHAV